ncbi:MAG: hypothetical protein HC913_20635, partial [Microscillaceae bacterium]|nr:hypothetical protein [Microscillaceae bacterium]
MKKTFEKCQWEELSLLFGLEKVKDLKPLANLLGADVQIDDITQKNLKRLNALLIDNFWNWNEDELKMQFISPLLFLVNYNDSEKYHPFSQRTMQMQTTELELSGVVEWLLASGKQIPRAPFFFLHEYKKSKALITTLW